MQSVRKAFDSYFASSGIRPVIADVGASGDQPRVWTPIAPWSHYIGFDPDSRDIRTHTQGNYGKSTFLPVAVSPDREKDRVTFRMTRSPHCSSILEPDHERLRPYLFARSFDVLDRVEVSSSSLNESVRQTGESHIDWLKLDVQGADLAVYHSLDKGWRDSMLALDYEAGLIHAYHGEDLYGTAHERLIAEGWWLSRLRLCGDVRMSRNALDAISVDEESVRRRQRISPGWVEARYLKDPAVVSRDQLPLLAVFCLLDGQFGVALEILQGIGPRDPGSEEVYRYCEAALQGRVPTAVGNEEMPRWEDLHGLTMDGVLRRFGPEELICALSPYEIFRAVWSRMRRRVLRPPFENKDVLRHASFSEFTPDSPKNFVWR